MRFFLFVLALIFSLSSLSAQPITKDLKLDWLIYSSQDQSYKTFTNDVLNEPLHIFINASDFQSQFIKIEVKGSGSIFINEKLVQNSQVDSLAPIVFLSLDSLVKVHNSESLHISMIGYKEIIETAIVPNRFNIMVRNGSNTMVVESRVSNNYTDSLVLFLFLASIFLLIFKLAKPKGFQNYFNFKAAFSIRSRNSVFYETRVLEIQSILFYFFYASFITLFIFFNFQNLIDIPLSASFLYIVYKLILVLILVFGLLLIKNVWIIIFSFIFDLVAFKRVQYYDNFRIGLAFLILLSLISVIQKQYFADFESAYFISQALIAFLLFRFVFLFIKLLRIATVKRIYLFSYLCVTELAPLFFVIKVLKSTNY
jgi:hypothetical protein